MVRKKLTGRSWLTGRSLCSWGGAASLLLLFGTSAALAQPAPLIIQRGSQPIADVAPAKLPIAPPAPLAGSKPSVAPPATNISQTPQPSATLPELPDVFVPPSPFKPLTLSTPAASPSNPGLLNPAPPPVLAPVEKVIVPTTKTTPVPPPLPVGMPAPAAPLKIEEPKTAPVFNVDVKTPLAEVRAPALPSAPLASAAPAPLKLPSSPPAVLPEGMPLTPPLTALPSATPVRAQTPAGTAPSGAPDVQKEYGQFVKKVVDPQTTLDLVVGRTRLLVLAEPPTRVQIGDEKLVVSEEISPTELSLQAKGLGTTVLNLWFADPQDRSKHKILSYLVRVYPDPQAKERLQNDYKSLADEINRAFPDSQVVLSSIGDKIAVSGQAKDAIQAAEILRIVRNHAPHDADSGGEESSDKPETGATATKQMQQAAGPNLVNRLHVPGEQQVMLRVTVAEVNRAAARSIGLNCRMEKHDGTNIFATRGAQLSGLTDMGGTNVPVFLDNGQVGLAIHALRSMNLAKSLAEPSLVALNGNRAEFDTGGKFPVPSADGVEFIPYGIHLNFTPFVTDRDCIRLQVQAEVSTKDLASTVNVACTPVPGLNTRKFQTTVELREGQTMAVAGLIQNNFGSASTARPGWCDVPLFGRLFSGDVTSTSEQELIVLITPELVHPLECKDAPALPGSDLIEPSDLEFYLLGRLQSGCGCHNPIQMKRLRHCEEVILSGPQGYSNGKE